MADASLPSDALRKQLESDAGPHATEDQKRAAAKRRAAAGISEPKKDERGQVTRETPKPAAKKV